MLPHALSSNASCRVLRAPEAPACRQMGMATPVSSRRIALALEYPLFQQGGTEVLVQELLRGLLEDWEVVLVSGDARRADLPGTLGSALAGHVFWDGAHGAAAAGEELARRLADLKVQLAHFHFGGTFVWRSNRYWRCPVYHLARAGVPCLATNHLATEWLNCGARPDRPVWQKHLFQALAILSRSLVLRGLRMEVCVSRHDRQRMVRMFPHFRRKLIQRYHSLLSEDAPGPELERRDPVVLCVGTIGGRKAQHLLAEAFSRIAPEFPEWRLRFVGRVDVVSDAERVRCVAREHRLEDRIQLPGRLSDEAVLAELKQASIFALPSLQEGLGLSLQEALFHGCVAVGTRAGGIPELIDDGENGFLVPPGDAGALSAALKRLLSDPSLRERLRRQCRPSIVRKGMTAAAMRQNYRALYEACLGGRVPAVAPA